MSRHGFSGKREALRNTSSFPTTEKNTNFAYENEPRSAQSDSSHALPRASQPWRPYVDKKAT
jgi:hypothetical protein